MTTVRDATAADFPRVAALLTQASLPLDGIPSDLDRFSVAEADGEVIGAAGIELYGDTALLRSTVVDPKWRKTGVGECLVESVLARSRAEGAREVYLLTTTASGYFPRFGFACVSRDEVPEAVRASAEFRGACPDSAVAMRRAER